MFYDLSALGECRFISPQDLLSQTSRGMAIVESCRASTRRQQGSCDGFSRWSCKSSNATRRRFLQRGHPDLWGGWSLPSLKPSENIQLRGISCHPHVTNPQKMDSTAWKIPCTGHTLPVLESWGLPMVHGHRPCCWWNAGSCRWTSEEGPAASWNDG